MYIEARVLASCGGSGTGRRSGIDTGSGSGSGTGSVAAIEERRRLKQCVGRRWRRRAPAPRLPRRRPTTTGPVSTCPTGCGSRPGSRFVRMPYAAAVPTGRRRCPGCSSGLGQRCHPIGTTMTATPCMTATTPPPLPACGGRRLPTALVAISRHSASHG